jgi:hypothetical protein
MATLTMSRIDELERLVIERFRLELKRCDLSDELTPTPQCRELNEQLRTISCYQREIWVELIPLLRQQRRNERLSGKAKKQARAEWKREIDKLNEKWTERTAKVCGDTGQHGLRCLSGRETRCPDSSSAPPRCGPAPRQSSR